MKKNNIFKQYFTPKDIADIIIDNIDGKNINSVIDLSVGEGDLLIASANKWKKSYLLGFDIDSNVINKFKGKITSKIELNIGDSLKEKTYLQSVKYGNILQNGGFDLCIGNPPFDAYYKVSVKGKKITVPIEYLFLKKYISICKKDGYIVIILPNGTLTNKSNKYIRDEILENTVVCKVISLPYNIFSMAYAKTEVIILKKNIETKNDNFTIEFINIDDELKIDKYILNNIKKEELAERMDCEYYINRNNIVNCEEENKINMKVEKLSDIIIEHKRGATVYGDKRYFVDTGLKYLHTTNLTNIGIDYKKKELYIEENSIMDKKSAHTKIRDVIFVRVGKSCAGRVAIIHSIEDIGVASDCLYIFRMRTVDPYYFVMIMKTKFMIRRLELIKHGSCASVISKQDLLNLNIPIMTNKIQEDISTRYKNILDDYKIENKKSIDNKLNDLINEVDNLLWREDSYEISS